MELTSPVCSAIGWPSYALWGGDMKRYYLVNTNRTHRPSEERRMLRHSQLSAQYGPKKRIDLIKKGDIVFLYRNIEGVVAYGIADGNLIIGDFEGHKDEQHFMHVDRFRIIKPPIKPSEITKFSNRMASTGVFYARTVSPLQPEVGRALLRLFK